MSRPARERVTAACHTLRLFCAGDAELAELAMADVDTAKGVLAVAAVLAREHAERLGVGLPEYLTVLAELATRALLSEPAPESG